jgi:hypothetical protein
MEDGPACQVLRRPLPGGNGANHRQIRGAAKRGVSLVEQLHVQPTIKPAALVVLSAGEASASQTLLAMLSASSIGIGPRLIRSASVSPGTSSMIRKLAPFVSAPGLLAECFDIGKILLATGGTFVGNELLSANIVDRHVSEVSRFLRGVRFLPRDAGERRDQVDSHGWHAQLHYLVWALKVVGVKVGKFKSKGSQRLENAPGIFWTRPHKDVDVTCKSGGTMKSQGISPDDQVLNVVFV